MQDNEATVAQVRQQVIGLERGHGELRQELHGVEQKMDRGFIAVDQKMAQGFNNIASKLDEKTTPQWQAYGIIATVLIAICGALFWPIREQTSKNDSQLQEIRMQLTAQVLSVARDLSYLQGQLHPLPK
jgi:argininosuccinate lyase